MEVSKKQPPCVFKHFSLPTLNSHFHFHQPPSSVNHTDLDDILISSEPQIRQPNPFSFSHVTDNQDLTAIKSSYSSSCGPNKISVALLKLCTHFILPQLTALINVSFSYAQFPTLWKNCCIRAFIKSITLSSPSDTKPRALLPEMARIKERVA